MNVRVTLKEYLKHRNLSAYRLAQATTGRVAERTVYALARPGVKRIDLETLGVVIEALEELTGEPVTPNDLLEVTQTPTPRLESLKPGKTDGSHVVSIPAQGRFKPRAPLLTNPPGQSTTSIINKARGER